MSSVSSCTLGLKKWLKQAAPQFSTQRSHTACLLHIPVCLCQISSILRSSLRHRQVQMYPMGPSAISYCRMILRIYSTILLSQLMLFMPLRCGDVVLGKQFSWSFRFTFDCGVAVQAATKLLTRNTWLLHRVAAPANMAVNVMP